MPSDARRVGGLAGIYYQVGVLSRSLMIPLAIFATDDPIMRRQGDGANPFRWFEVEKVTPKTIQVHGVPHSEAPPGLPAVERIATDGAPPDHGVRRGQAAGGLGPNA